MSAEGATAFYERVTSDESFRAQLEAAATREERRRIVTEAGYDISGDDLPTIRELAGLSEISDDDLEKVAGGIDVPADLLQHSNGGIGVRWVIEATKQ